MAVKRASLRGKGASIFFGDEAEQAESAELANSETAQANVGESDELSQSGTARVADNRTAEATNSQASNRRGRSDELSSDSVADLQSDSVADYASFDDAHFDSSVATSPIGYTEPTSRLANSGTSQADNFDSRQASTQREQAISRLANSSTSQIANSNSAASGRERGQASSRLANSGTSQADNFATVAPTRRDSQAARDLQSSPVANSRSSRVGNYDSGSQTMIADETRAEYVVAYDDDSLSQPLQRPTFSAFYANGDETHYLMLEPLATRITTEQMDRLSALERRIHQGRRRKEPRVTKNSIIRALLEATFDLDLDTRDINSETELVNRFREALHLADIVGELRGR